MRPDLLSRVSMSKKRKKKKVENKKIGGVGAICLLDPDVIQ